MKKITLVILAAFLVTSCYNTQKAQQNNQTEQTVKTPEIDRSVMPKPGPAPTVNVKSPEIFTLKNGLKVLVVEDHKLPRVSMDLLIDNPPLAFGSKKGLTELLSSLMGNGTSKISKEKYNELIDFYGANVNIYNRGAHASSLKRYFPEVMKLAAQGALDPLFSQKEFDKEKSRLLESLKNDEKNVKSVSNDLRDYLAFGEHHPFGEFYTAKTIKNVSLKDVQNHYKKYYSPQNAYLAIIGDIDLPTAKKLVEENFSTWKNVKIERINYPEPKNVTKTQIDFIDMPNAVQTELAAINITNLKLSDSDYFAALLANQILGGGGEGRLFNNLREAHGWTYGAYSRIAANKEVERFSATTSVRNSVTDSAIVELMNEIKKIRTEPVTEKELAIAKAKYIGSFVMSAQKPGVIANRALTIETQNLPKDFFRNFIKNIEAVTVEQVQAAAKKYFSADNSRIVVVGKAEDIVPTLDRLGYSVNFYTKEGKKTENPLKNQATVSAGITAKKIIDDYLKAIGGESNAKALKTLKMDIEMTGAAPQALEVQQTLMAPNLEKQVIKMNGAVVSQVVFDGNVLKMSGMMGSSEQSGEAVADKKNKKGIISQAFYKKDQMELAGISKLEGKDVYKIKIKEGKQNFTEFYDVKTGLLLQSVAVEKTPQGDVQITTLYKDYKKVDGILLPFTIEQEVGPQKLVNTIKNIEVNKNVSKADFK